MIKFGKLGGVPQFEKGLRDMVQKAPIAAGRGLYMGLEFVMTEAKMNFVPVDFGILRASGFVHVKREGKFIIGTIGFGGPAGSGNSGGETNREDVNYAVIQHENLDFKHTVGSAKYLERPLFAGLPMVGETIAETIRKDLT